MHIHPQVIVHSLRVIWLNNYVAQPNIMAFKNACVSFFHENDIAEWLSFEKLSYKEYATKNRKKSIQEV